MTARRAGIAIVGGGLAGLYAAWRLQRLGVNDFVLLEARPRLGGRILTVDAAGRPVAPGSPGRDGFDLGPAWLWPEVQRELGTLVGSLGLPCFEQAEDGDMVVERSPHAAPLRMPGYRSAPPSVRLVGGMGALVEALRRGVPDSRILTACPVHQLLLRDGQVEVRAEALHGGQATWHAGHVLLAVPPRLALQTIHFAPALPPALAQAWRSTETWMAPHAKYLAVYDTPFWRAQGLSGAARSACGPLAEVHDASAPGGPAALFGFVGLPARQRDGLGDEALRAHCRAQLGRLFGPQALAPLADRLQDWAADPLTATEADRVGSGLHPEPPPRSAAEGPWQGRLTGIGSEWSPRFPGYLAGAVEAAEQGVLEAAPTAGR